MQLVETGYEENGRKSTLAYRGISAENEQRKNEAKTTGSVSRGAFTVMKYFIFSPNHDWVRETGALHQIRFPSRRRVLDVWFLITLPIIMELSLRFDLAAKPCS